MAKVWAAAAVVVVLATPTFAAPQRVIVVQPTPVTVHVDTPKLEPISWDHDPVWITAIATVALTVVTALLWVFTGLMWWEARNSRRDTRAALKLAHDANEIAERSIFEQNRPWVFVKDIRFEPERDVITISFTNMGKTPAKRFRKTIKGDILPVPFPSSPLPDPDQGYASVLAPGAVEVLTMDKPGPMPNSYEYRIRIALSYEMQNGEIYRLDEDYACDGDGRIRKVTPKDFAAFHGLKTYTIGESYPISQ